MVGSPFRLYPDLVSPTAPVESKKDLYLQKLDIHSPYKTNNNHKALFDTSFKHKKNKSSHFNSVKTSTSPEKNKDLDLHFMQREFDLRKHNLMEESKTLQTIVEGQLDQAQENSS